MASDINQIRESTHSDSLLVLKAAKDNHVKFIIES
jgi:hypothetical protein